MWTLLVTDWKLQMETFVSILLLDKKTQQSIRLRARPRSANWWFWFWIKCEMLLTRERDGARGTGLVRPIKVMRHVGTTHQSTGLATHQLWSHCYISLEHDVWIKVFSFNIVKSIKNQKMSVFMYILLLSKKSEGIGIWKDKSSKYCETKFDNFKSPQLIAISGPALDWWPDCVTGCYKICHTETPEGVWTPLRSLQKSWRILDMWSAFYVCLSQHMGECGWQKCFL